MAETRESLSKRIAKIKERKKNNPNYPQAAINKELKLLEDQLAKLPPSLKVKAEPKASVKVDKDKPRVKTSTYDPTKKSGKLLPQSKTTLKQRMAKVDKYFSLDPKVRSKIRKDKYDALSDTQKNTLSGVKTAAEVASYFIPGGALRLAIPVVRGIQAAKTGFKVGNKTYKTLKEAKAAKNKLQKIVNTKTKSIDPKTKKLKPVQDKEKTKKATTDLKTQTTRDLTKQQKALKARQDKTTKILKGSSNVALAGGALMAATKGDSSKSKKVNATTIKKPTNRQQKLKTISKFRPISKAEPPQLKKPISKAKPPQLVGPVKAVKTKKTTDIKGPAKRPASIIAGSGKGLGTLSEIAFKHGTTVKELMKENKDIKDANVIKKGQKIKLGKVVKNRKSVYQKKKGGTVYRRGGGKALRGFGKATYSNKLY